jgi:hypothetical protein
MKASELRISNLITMPHHREYNMKVLGVSPDGIYTNMAHLTEDNFEPIPITQEWLDIFGLNKDKGTMDLLFDYIVYFERQGNQLFLCNNQTKVQYLIEYVHEAQNIYFALTGKELTIKQ